MNINTHTEKMLTYFIIKSNPIFDLGKFDMLWIFEDLEIGNCLTFKDLKVYKQDMKGIKPIL